MIPIFILKRWEETEETRADVNSAKKREKCSAEARQRYERATNSPRRYSQSGVPEGWSRARAGKEMTQTVT